MRRAVTCFALSLTMLMIAVAGCIELENPKPLPGTPSYADRTAEFVERSTLDLSVGQKRLYTFSEKGINFGYCEYQVMRVDDLDGVRTYTIGTSLELDSSSTCSPTRATAVLQIDERGNPLSYNLDAHIGKG